jgi:hypothetical protein
MPEVSPPIHASRSLLVDWLRYAALGAVVTAALLALASGGNNQGIGVDVAERSPRRSAPAACGATMDEFSQLRVGMTYEQVREIIGCDGEVQSHVSLVGIDSTMYGWRGAGRWLAGNMNATFQNGHLVSKAQFLLR